MLTNAAHLKGITIQATDGKIGTVDQFFFDDETWAIRYLTVGTDGWLGDRQVLISPFSIVHTDWQARRLDVSLTKKQVENSPNIDTHQPVSRQHESVYMGYYGYPYYWSGPNMWGPASYPSGLPVPTTVFNEAQAKHVHKASMDSHLRSNKAVTGYHIEASDGEIGHVEGFIMDDRAWAIRYMEVGTRNWWPGKRYWFLRRGFRASVGSTPKSTLAFRERRSRPGRSSSNPRPSRASMKTDSTATTAKRPIGCMKTNQSLRLPWSASKSWRGHPETRMPAMFSGSADPFRYRSLNWRLH